MALQYSGAISISDIRNEQVYNGGFGSTYSLRALSSNAGFGTPDAMSEFYGYSATPTPSCWYYTAYYWGYYGWQDCYSGLWSYGYQDYGFSVCARSADGLSYTGTACLV